MGTTEQTETATLIQAAVAAQRAVAHALFSATAHEWIQLELTIGQIKALMALYSRGALHVGALAGLLGISKPTASILADGLVQRGYVERREDPEDRRRAILALSPAGSDLVARLRQGGGEQRLTRWLEGLAPEDLAALTRGLRALAAAVGSGEGALSAHAAARPAAGASAPATTTG